MHSDIDEDKEIICPNCGEVLKLELDFKSGGYYVPVYCPVCGQDLSELINEATKQTQRS